MPTVRIIGGACRSRRIPVPRNVRPTLDRVRESLFNRLGRDLGGKRVLDLFAGTGALGLEALSRGAKTAVFVEKSAAALDRIRDSAGNLGFDGSRAECFRQDARRWLRTCAPGKFDIVFADPPYRATADPGDWKNLLRLVKAACAGEDSVVYCEGGADMAPDDGEWNVVHKEISGSAHWTLLSPAGGKDLR